MPTYVFWCDGCKQEIYRVLKTKVEELCSYCQHANKHIYMRYLRTEKKKRG